MTIIYPVPEFLPDARARFIQIINTCHSLAQTGARVYLLAGIRSGYSDEKVLNYYGIPPNPNLTIVRLPIMRREHAQYFRFSWHGVFHFFLLFFLFSRKVSRSGQTVLFLRYLKLAHFLRPFRKLLKLPAVFEVHEIFHLTTSNKKKKARIEDMEASVYKSAEAVISISHSIKEVLISAGVPEKVIHVVHNGIDPKWFDIKKSLPGSYICYTGSLYRWKGVDTLIAAMKYLPKETLRIVGGGKRLEALKALAADERVADRITFVGAIPHRSIPDYLAQAQVAVLPNIPAGPSQFSSPLKLFEYMACGIPIVASDLPVFREILIHEKNALLFNADSPKSLAENVQRVLEDQELAQHLAREAKQDAREYTYDKRATKILATIRALFP